MLEVFDLMDEKRDVMESLLLPQPVQQAFARAALTYHFGEDHQTDSINVTVWQRYGLLSPAVLKLKETLVLTIFRKHSAGVYGDLRKEGCYLYKKGVCL